MNKNISRTLAALFLVSLLSSAQLVQVRAQDKPRPNEDEVLRVDTDLVQTAVTVTDEKGKPVEGLTREQFQLAIDGQQQPIRFFERVAAGSDREAKLTAPGDSTVASGSQPSYRGRTVIFFVDDLHLSPGSLDRSRQAILHFVNEEMSSRDLVAVASSSGLIGFLQQFTDNRDVLRAAVGRLLPRPIDVYGYMSLKTPMSEVIALMIDNRSDPGVTDVYIEECLKQGAGAKRDERSRRAMRDMCEIQVKNSARVILTQAGAVTDNMYTSLETLVQSAGRLPGRKVAFFLSDGFLLDTGSRSRSVMDRLQNVTADAGRAGVVFYTIDARGLVSGIMDATHNMVADANGRLESARLREVVMTQDAMNALARDTGGRALRNQNEFDGWIEKSLDETSNYYLLAWRPETNEQKTRTFRRVEVTIPGRPDLKVRLPRGFVDGSNPPAASANNASNKTQPAAAKTPEGEIRDALSDFFSRGELPTLVSLSYLNTPNNGMVLTSSMQVAGGAIKYPADGKQSAAVDVAGVVLNDKGKIAASFNNRLNVNTLASNSDSGGQSDIIFNHRSPVAPGIYQVRVAARDRESGRVGSSSQWIVIPDLSSNNLTLSSLLIGGKVVKRSDSRPAQQQAEPEIQFSVDHRFARSSHLDVLFFVYNAARDGNGSGSPNLLAQVDVLREGRAVISSPSRRVSTEGAPDLARIPYADSLALASLPVGRYELRVTVKDLKTNNSTVRITKFDVE